MGASGSKGEDGNVSVQNPVPPGNSGGALAGASGAGGRSKQRMHQSKAHVIQGSNLVPKPPEKPSPKAKASAAGTAAFSGGRSRTQQLSSGSPSSAGGAAGGHPNTLNGRRATVDEIAVHRQQADLSTSEIDMNRWRVGECLGQGSFGQVYMGIDMETGELAVIKRSQITDQEAKLELMKEITTLSKVRHENIVSYLGFSYNHLDGDLRIYLEYMPGGSIADLLKRFGPLTESVIRRYLRDVLQGLDYLHKKGIIHRDIKGANILVDNAGVCKLADFGASKQLANDSQGNVSDSINESMNRSSGGGSLKGTPKFMAPEVLMDNKYSRRSDIWSLGCTVIQMLTAAAPWAQFSNPWTAMIQQVRNPKPPDVPDGTSAALRDFVSRCFHTDPRQRPSARELSNHPFMLMEAPTPKSTINAGNRIPGDSPLSAVMAGGRDASRAHTTTPISSKLRPLRGLSSPGNAGGYQASSMPRSSSQNEMTPPRTESNGYYPAGQPAAGSKNPLKPGMKVSVPTKMASPAGAPKSTPVMHQGGSPGVQFGSVPQSPGTRGTGGRGLRPLPASPGVPGVRAPSPSFAVTTQQGSPAPGRLPLISPRPGQLQPLPSPSPRHNFPPQSPGFPRTPHTENSSQQFAFSGNRPSAPSPSPADRRQAEAMQAS